MFSKKYAKLYFGIIFSIIFIIIYSSSDKKKDEIIEIKDEEILYNSNIIENVRYITKDKDGNEYIISAKEAEIDFSEPNIFYLTGVSALIKLKNLEEITIISDYGKYNSENFDTIFSKNVIINYLENEIRGKYLDFSLVRNFMIISNEVEYKNLDNTLKADVIELNINTKDLKIFMHEENKKVKISNKN